MNEKLLDTSSITFTIVAGIVALFISLIIGYVCDDYKYFYWVFNFVFFEIISSFVKKYFIKFMLETACPYEKDKKMEEYTSKVYSFACLIYMILGKLVPFLSNLII